jgi:hypothetical protein
MTDILDANGKPMPDPRPELPTVDLTKTTVDDEQAVTSVFGPRTEKNAYMFDRTLEKMQKEQRRRTSKCAPLGQSGLPASVMPPLLDQRRVELAITDAHFKLYPLWDTVYVVQLPEHETFETDSGLVLPDNKKRAMERSSPRGILIAAGLRALDSLRSNGVDLGHFVRFSHVAPWRYEVGYHEGKYGQLLVLTAGQIKGSEDLMTMLRERSVEIVAREGKHCIATEDGTLCEPQMTDQYD